MISGLVDITILFLWIVYIFMGAYEAGKSAPELRERDSVMRVLRRSFGWPYYMWKEFKEEDDKKWRL